jgi:benzylsuccinate CoA-transferase BbsF subunit
MNKAQPERDGNRDRWMAPHDCFKCAGDDDKWVTIACGSEAEWQALCQAMGKPELATDKRFANVTARKAKKGRWKASSQLGRRNAIAGK